MEGTDRLSFSLKVYIKEAGSFQSFREEGLRET
jgi:hypothetical protein